MPGRRPRWMLAAASVLVVAAVAPAAEPPPRRSDHTGTGVVAGSATEGAAAARAASSDATTFMVEWKQEPAFHERVRRGHQCAQPDSQRGNVTGGAAVVAPDRAAARAGGEWRPLFDGLESGGWKPTPFGGEGEVTVVDGCLRIAAGGPLSGVTWDGEFPRQDYELALEARRVEGDDFFCGLTFPVGAEACSLILGGWGGGTVGLSCVDGADASENATSQYHEFERGRWYDVVVRVTPERIECLLDGERIIEQPLEGRRVSVRVEVAASRPLGIATYGTTADMRNIRWRPLAAPAEGGRPTP